MIENMPFEAHLPFHEYCGPGTKLAKKLANNVPGISKLDEACKAHDIFYSKNKELSKRHEADKILAEAAWNRVKAPDSKFGEKAAAWAVTNAMKAKVKLGLGMKKKNLKKKNLKKRKAAGKKTTKGKGISLQKLIKTARVAIKKSKAKTAQVAIREALNSVKPLSKKNANVKIPRILPVVKHGGILPLIPILAGLSAIGALTGGAAQVAKAVKDTQAARKSLEEAHRHNKTMEAIAIGKGFFLRPYKKGYGLEINSKNSKPCLGNR